MDTTDNNHTAASDASRMLQSATPLAGNSGGTNTSEAMLMVMQQVFGQQSPQLSDEQMGKVIGLNERAMDYTHADNDKAHDRFLLVAGQNQHRFYVVVIAISALVVLVAARFPEHFLTMLTYLGTAFGGYGVGRITSKPPEQQGGA